MDFFVFYFYISYKLETMDVKLIKQRLASLQTRGNSDKNKRAETVWKAPIGKHQIRIIPAKWDKDNPFREVFVHYGIGNRTMIALSNFGEKDPIVEFAKQLRQTSDKENWSLAKKLEPKMRVFSPVIVRGEEDKGVRLWEFGKQVYQELLSIADDPDVGDYTDPIQGRDITIETTGPETNGTSFNQSKVRVRTKQTALSESAQEVEKWLSNQPDVFSIFKKYGYDEMKEALVGFLNPEDQADEPAPVAPTPAAAPASDPLTQSTFELHAKKSIDDEFDELFNLK